MSVKSAPYYWLECDGCKVKSTEDGDVSAWSDKGDALDQAVEYGEWVLDDQDGHFCFSCQEPCPACLTRCRPKTMEACPDCQLTLTPGGQA